MEGRRGGDRITFLYEIVNKKPEPHVLPKNKYILSVFMYKNVVL